MANFEPDNPARPAAGVRLCALDEIKDPGGKSFRFRDGSRMFAGFVIRQGDAAQGFVDSCPHAGWPLATSRAASRSRSASHCGRRSCHDRSTRARSSGLMLSMLLTDAAARIPGAWVEVVPGAGHFPWLDVPGCVRRALRRLC